ncbi:MAG TPA: RsmD family RNA methyltransferase [Burkholderiaceae bacterium]|nr:RsmD family RNA methyltransferase [Burkholderiaceae bacterium]
MRIVGGRWKRTAIAVPASPGLRPTPDRVRETLFNWLAFLRPDFSGLRGLDLFAGSGALGFEFASRGAGAVLLVERHPQRFALLMALKTRLAAKQLEIRHGDALQIAGALAAASFDVIFLDPPFDAGLLEPALEQACRLLAPGGLIYVETGMPLEAGRVHALRLSPVREGRAGRVWFYLLAPDAS